MSSTVGIGLPPKKSSQPNEALAVSQKCCRRGQGAVAAQGGFFLRSLDPPIDTNAVAVGALFPFPQYPVALRLVFLEVLPAVQAMETAVAMPRVWN